MRIVRVMCSGRVDPVMIIEAFASGSDGVFVGACRRGECHYSTGNLHAEVKIELTSHVLATIGISPDRLVMRMMSSAEGNKFVEFITEFQRRIRDIGPLGRAEGLQSTELKTKLAVAKGALQGRKLRWVVGKVVEFKEKSNLYDETFTDHEIGRLFEEIVMDELRIREILERMKTEPKSAKRLSKEMNVPAMVVLRQLADMGRMGLAEIKKIEGRSPVWGLRGDAVYE